MVFFSHIAFMFQKKGISHFWHASASAHSGVCTDIDGKYEETRLGKILQLGFQTEVAQNHINNICAWKYLRSDKKIYCDFSLR